MPTKTGEEMEAEAVALKTAVGHGLMMWSLVETALQETFAQLVDERFPGVGRAIFHAPAGHGFASKLTLTDAALRARAPPEDVLVVWKWLSKRLKNRLYPKRNELAHFTIKSVAHNGIFQGVFVAPFHDAIWAEGSADPIELGVVEINERAGQFYDASRDVWWVYEAVREHQGLTNMASNFRSERVEAAISRQGEAGTIRGAS